MPESPKDAKTVVLRRAIVDGKGGGPTTLRFQFGERPDGKYACALSGQVRVSEALTAAVSFVDSLAKLLEIDPVSLCADARIALEARAGKVAL